MPSMEAIEKYGSAVMATKMGYPLQRPSQYAPLGALHGYMEHFKMDEYYNEGHNAMVSRPAVPMPAYIAARPPARVPVPKPSPKKPKSHRAGMP